MRHGVGEWCPRTAPGLLCRVSPRGSRDGQRAPWVLGTLPLRSSCPFKSKSRESGGWGALAGPLFPRGSGQGGKPTGQERRVGDEEGGVPGVPACTPRRLPGPAAPLSRTPARRGRWAEAGARGRGAGARRAGRSAQAGPGAHAAAVAATARPAALLLPPPPRPGRRPPIWCSRPRRRQCGRPRARPPPSGARSAAAAGGGLRPGPEPPSPRQPAQLAPRARL